MKRFKIFDMIRCFFEKKSDRCEGCRLEKAAKTLPYGIRENAEALMNDVLEPVREVYGKPFVVVNGFCCPVRLRMMGECVQNPLAKGEAAVISVARQPGMTDKDVALENLELAKAVIKVKGFDVMVLGDVPEDSMEPRWIRIAYKRNGGNLGMIVKKVRGRAQYEELSFLDLEQMAD